MGWRETFLCAVNHHHHQSQLSVLCDAQIKVGVSNCTNNSPSLCLDARECHLITFHGISITFREVQITYPASPRCDSSIEALSAANRIILNSPAHSPRRPHNIRPPLTVHTSTTSQQLLGLLGASRSVIAVREQDVREVGRSRGEAGRW